MLSCSDVVFEICHYIIFQLLSTAHPDCVFQLLHLRLMHDQRAGQKESQADQH